MGFTCPQSRVLGPFDGVSFFLGSGAMQEQETQWKRWMIQEMRFGGAGSAVVVTLACRGPLFRLSLTFLPAGSLLSSHHLLFSPTPNFHPSLPRPRTTISSEKRNTSRICLMWKDLSDSAGYVTMLFVCQGLPENEVQLIPSRKS